MSDPSSGSKPFDSSEIKEIDVFVLRRVQELTTGDHKSVFKGGGFDLVGLREWQPGDKLSSVDWPQSAVGNYDPILVREFEEDKGGTIFIIADRSLSVLCGLGNFSSRDMILRTIATIGFSGVFFQDSTGLFIFDGQHHYQSIRPRMGKNHVISCVNNYDTINLSHSSDSFLDLAKKAISGLRRTSIIPVISDLLFENISGFVESLAAIKIKHDVFMVMLDCSFLFNLPAFSDGWIECTDVESGRSNVISRNEFLSMAARAVDYQNRAVEMLRSKGIEVVKVRPDRIEFLNNLIQFFFIRRTKRKVSF